MRKPRWVREDRLFSALKLGVREWQFGHRISRFSGRLFVESPSMWLTSRGTLPVVGFISPHPHLGHLWLHCLSSHRFIAPEQPNTVLPVISPFNQAFMSNLAAEPEQLWLQYLFPGFVFFPHTKQSAISPGLPCRLTPLFLAVAAQLIEQFGFFFFSKGITPLHTWQCLGFA